MEADHPLKNTKQCGVNTVFGHAFFSASLLSKVVSAHDRLKWSETTLDSKLAKRMHGHKLYLLHTTKHSLLFIYAEFSW